MTSSTAGTVGPAPAGSSFVRRFIAKNFYAAVPLAMLIVLYVVNVAVQPEFAHQEGWASRWLCWPPRC